MAAYLSQFVERSKYIYAHFGVVVSQEGQEKTEDVVVGILLAQHRGQAK
jgi:hypothetical protein